MDNAAIRTELDRLIADLATNASAYDFALRALVAAETMHGGYQKVIKDRAEALIRQCRAAAWA